MWRRKKHYSVMGMDMDLDHVNMKDVKKLATVVITFLASPPKMTVFPQPGQFDSSVVK